MCLVVHRKELKRTTNTGRLAIRALLNSEMRIRGDLAQGGEVALDLSDLLSNQYQSLFVYPSDEALELTPDFIKQFDKPLQLIVPDGNWRQAGKVHYRHSELKDVIRVKLASSQDLGGESVQEPPRMRKETVKNGMATLEAIAHALGVIEGVEVQKALLDLYSEKLNRTLKARGTLQPD